MSESGMVECEEELEVRSGSWEDRQGCSKG